MRTVGIELVALVTSLLVAGSAYASWDAELDEMRALVEELGQKVDAQQEQLEHQGGLLQDAQKVVREQQQEDGALSGVGEFWQAIDVNMSVASSYAFNVRNPNEAARRDTPGAGLNQGESALFYLFQRRRQQLPGRPGLDRHREGGHRGEPRGSQMTTLRQDGLVPGQSSRRTHATTRNEELDERILRAPGVVQYLAPVSTKHNVHFGKFATPIGAEAADAPKNWAVTRGNV